MGAGLFPAVTDFLSYAYSKSGKLRALFEEKGQQPQFTLPFIMGSFRNCLMSTLPLVEAAGIEPTLSAGEADG